MSHATEWPAFHAKEGLACHANNSHLGRGIVIEGNGQALLGVQTIWQQHHRYLQVLFCFKNISSNDCRGPSLQSFMNTSPHVLIWLCDMDIQVTSLDLHNTSVSVFGICWQRALYHVICR